MKETLYDILTICIIIIFVFLFGTGLNVYKRSGLSNINENPLIANMVVFNDTLREEAHENMILRAQGCTSELCLKTKPYLFHSDLTRKIKYNNCELTVDYYYWHIDGLLNKVRIKDTANCIEHNYKFGDEGYVSSDGFTYFKLKYDDDFENYFVKTVKFNGKYYKF